MSKKENKKEFKDTIDLAKEIVRLRDKEHKKVHTIAGMLGLTEMRVIYLAKAFDKAME